MNCNFKRHECTSTILISMCFWIPGFLHSDIEKALGKANESLGVKNKRILTSLFRALARPHFEYEYFGAHVVKGNFQLTVFEHMMLSGHMINISDISIYDIGKSR